MSALRRWWALAPGDRLRLLLLMLVLPLVSLALRSAGYQRTRNLVERLSGHPQPRTASNDDIESALGFAQLAATAGRRGPVEATCLRQALVVYGALRRRGLQPQLKFGVRREGDSIDAHAWVELEQRSLDVNATRPHQPFAH
ncbi:lasso peptide biosynthesis B2 protein [Lysobacter niabensis]|uniref:lasso peptide biosynthesis B2 protein n=1 Tax=Agrilutibacter niabensis TaxID=380628 RepID=UPI00360A5AC5